MSNDRGVAHVLGVILMAGFAITIAATVAVAGASMFADSQSQIETSQVESSFSSLAADASELEDNESVDFDLGTADGELDVKEDMGHLNITHATNDTQTTVYEGDLNSLEYTTENGDTIGYQAGGVFRQQGSGSSVISAPDFYYRDNAMSFPIQTVDPESDIQSSGTLGGKLTLEREDRHYPNATEGKLNPLQGGVVYIEIESEYGQGWEQYFNQQTRGSVTEGFGEDHATGNEDVVQVKLSVPFQIDDNTFNYGLQAGSIEGYDDSEEDDNITEGELNVDSTELLLDRKASECDGSFDDELSDIDEGGLYCLDSIDEEHTFDTDNIEGTDDIQIYVDGDVEVVNDGLEVNGDENDVVFYINGDLKMNSKVDANSDTVLGNADPDPSQTVIFVSEDGYVFSDDDNNQGDAYAIIYAPDSSGYVQASNFEFTGSMILGDADFQGNPEDNINWDTDLSDFSYVDQNAGPEFYYLHVTERTVTASG